MVETKTILESNILRVSTPREDSIREYRKADLEAEKARIEALLAEFDKE